MENQNSVIKTNMAKETSDKLLGILKQDNYDNWSFEAFKAANEILDERGVDVPVELKVGEKPKAVLTEKERNRFLQIEENNIKYKYTFKEIKSKLRANILEGKHNKTSLVAIHNKEKGGKWEQKESTLFEFAKDHFKLRSLYQPVWSHAMFGLKWGIFVGVGLKLLDSLITLAYIDITLALLFLAAIIVIFVPKIGFYGVIGLLIIMFKYTDYNVNIFMTVLVSGLVGAIIGCLPGMAIGGIIGFSRKNSLPLAMDATPEPDGLIYKAVLLPLIGGCGLLFFYIFLFSPWLISVLE